jgi:membrane associated rhomboid family serine protease
MPNCISCGRELPSPNEPHNICPECRAAIIQRAQSSAPLPQRKSISLARVPVTSAIIGINALVFLAMAFTGSSPVEPNIPDLIKWGANDGLVTLVAQPWRMLVSNYVHIGIIHIALNMWCLWNLGILAEQIFDRWTYFLTYTFCGIMGSLVSIVLHPIRVGAGASGAIFGMAGALISALYLGHLPVHPSALKATLKSLLSFAGYNLFFGAVVPAIDNSAHIGGLVCGLAMGAALAPHLTSPPDERSTWNRWIFILAALLFAAAYYLARHYVPMMSYWHPSSRS